MYQSDDVVYSSATTISLNGSMPSPSGLPSTNSSHLSYALVKKKSVFSESETACFLRPVEAVGGDAELILRKSLYKLTMDFLRPFGPYLEVIR